MMRFNSFTVLYVVFGTFGTGARIRQMSSSGISLLDEMCEGSNVKDMLAIAFQLESLILAQNERWRQA